MTPLEDFYWSFERNFDNLLKNVVTNLVGTVVCAQSSRVVNWNKWLFPPCIACFWPGTLWTKSGFLQLSPSQSPSRTCCTMAYTAEPYETHGHVSLPSAKGRNTLPFFSGHQQKAHFGCRLVVSKMPLAVWMFSIRKVYHMRNGRPKSESVLIHNK